jgi:hypothetical protein
VTAVTFEKLITVPSEALTREIRDRNFFLHQRVWSRSSKIQPPLFHTDCLQVDCLSIHDQKVKTFWSGKEMRLPLSFEDTALRLNKDAAAIGGCCDIVIFAHSTPQPQHIEAMAREREIQP